MNRLNHGAPKLPQTLLEKVQGNGDGNSTYKGRSQGRSQGRPVGRKEQRKAQRDQKKQHQRPRRPPGKESQAQRDIALKADVRASSRPSQTPKTQSEPTQVPKSILKKAPRQRSPEDSSSESEVAAPISRAVKAKLDDDDAEIAALEKRLGLKGKKKMSKGEDGLGDLLDGLDEFDDGTSGKRKRSEYDEYLSSKRRQVENPNEMSTDEFSQSDEFGESGSSDAGEFDLESELEEGGEDEDAGKDSFDGFDSDEENGTEGEDEDSEDFGEIEKPKRKRENPYIPAVSSASTSTNTSTGKYVPPSMRGAPSSETEAMTRLRRQLQGLLNRLSEANLLGIARDVEVLYSSNARQHVTTILIDLLMGLLCDRTTLMDTTIILHAGFAAAMYRVVGAHFGAQLLERIVTEFDKFYAAEKEAISGAKETTNLMALLAELYTFQLVGSSLMFDYIRLFLSELTNLNTELLLKIIKNCGSQLRSDDPSSLKDIVIMLQKSVSKIGESNLSVRTKFMIETIDNLKNNRQKTGLVASSMAAEHTTRMKKTLGNLNAKSKGSEPLGVSLADIRGGSKEGKWWLVGASWKNEIQHPDVQHDGIKPASKSGKEDDDIDTTNASTDLFQLAKEQRMNTDIRRAIFMNIMSASDYKDAHMRLIKLKLKKAQELEIPRVLIHCAGSEQSYNPYYTLIAKRLCSEHRYKWAMQYGLWDLFKRMGERNNGGDDSDDDMDDEESDSAIDLRKIVNLGRMYGNLVADDSLSLTSLKVLNFAYLQPKTKSFLEILLLTAFKQVSKVAKEKDTEPAAAIATLLTRAKDTPQVVSGLQYFLTKQVNPADITSNASERKTLKSALRTAKIVLGHLVVSTSTSDSPHLER